jgi:gliding motility-associated-like protein
MRSGLLFIFLVLGTWDISRAQINLNDGLVGCYPFSGNAEDFSPTGNNGTVQGALLVPDRFGNDNSAYSFDGIDDYIEISAANLELNEFTYSIWVKPQMRPNYGQGLFFFSIGSDYGDQHILLGDHYSMDRHTGFSHGSYLGVANNILCSEPGVREIDRWYHLVLVRNKSEYILYVNNAMVCTNSHNGQRAFYGTSTVRAMIGARNNYGQAARAHIDDIHLYNRALNGEEISALFIGQEETPSSGNILANKQQICAGEIVTFTAESNIVAGETRWFVDNKIQSGPSSNELGFSPLASSNSYTVRITAEIVPSPSCFLQKPLRLEKEFQVVPCSQETDETRALFVPDIFTPNQDGLNDTWNIVNIDQLKSPEVTVYNRWGEVIFHSSYETAWNGTYKEKLVPIGVYTFKITSADRLVKSGRITVMY